ncbi:MAG: hypothetical protein ABSF67_20420 [Roseiarcus sp.]|jgi:hypothetical protein
MKKLALLGALLLAPVLPLAGCVTQAQQNAFNANLIRTTQNVVALNNALIQVDKTILDNVIAQAKLLAPYQCGAYALASAILNDSSASAKVNAYLAKDVAANVTNVAVKDICKAVGYPTTVTAAPSATAAPAASGS